LPGRWAGEEAPRAFGALSQYERSPDPAQREVTLTPGGVHSEMQIPQGLAPLRARHPHMALRYAWPFELDRIAQMLAEHLRSFLR